jgi:hypothetical protein
VHLSTGIPVILSLALLGAGLGAETYSRALDDPLNAYDAPVPGFTGPHGTGKARIFIGLDEENEPLYQNPDNFTNPLFFAWVETVADYQRSDSDLSFSDSTLALGPVTGDAFEVVALGELNATAIAAGSPPGTITLALPQPVKNLSGADFVVFENGVIARSDFGGAGIGGIFGELAYVEVSADGANFVRFPGASATTSAVNGYGSIDPTKVRNLAGKHVNGYGDSWGTPFDLAEVGLSQITHIRLVDIPGNGSFLDSTGRPVYDPWPTFGSGGFDLEAVGAISTSMTYADWPQLAKLPAEDRGPGADPDGDGVCNLLEYAFATLPWQTGSAAPELRLADGHAEIRFIRDERLTDLVYEVQASSGMSADDWITIASSSGGAALQGANGHAPVISETSAETIRSVGVIRRCTVRDVVPAAQARRFLRVKVTTTSASIP